MSAAVRGDRPLPAVLLAAALIAACSRGAEGGPRPTSVTPDRGPLTVRVPVRIEGQFEAAVKTDFSRPEESEVDARFEVRLGDVPLEDVQLRPDGSIAAIVPAGLPTGPYDLSVVDSRGRVGTLPRAYRVLAPEDTTAAVAGFRIDVAGPQEAFRPFTVTITAVDAADATVEAFRGEVRLADATGTAVPAVAGLFVAGRWSGSVEIRAAHAGDVLTATDDEGNSGSSAPFAVAPAPAAHLAFATAPRAGEAGRCEGPVTLALLDAFGSPTQAAGPTTLSLDASPAEGFELFDGDSCTTSIAAPALAGGAETTSVSYRATRAGPLDLVASGPSLSSAAQRHTVAPAAPAVLAFATTPQTVKAGVCSQPATLEVRDAFGNVAALSAPATVKLSAVPAAGFTFHAGAGCAVPATTTVTIEAGASATTFTFMGTTAGAVSVGGAAPEMTPAPPQAETVEPAPPDRLVFLTAPQITAAGQCSAAARIESRDVYGNPSPVAASTDVALAAAPGAGFSFHSDPGCATTAVTTTSLAEGASTADLHWRGTVPGNVAVTATVAGWAVPASQTASVTPGAPDQLVWDAIPSPQAQGVPFAVTVRARDAWGNATPGFTGTASLAASSGTVSCASSCAGAAEIGGFSAGVWTGYIAVHAPGGAITVSASSGGVGGTSSPFDVIAAPSRSPPTARLTVSPAVILANEAVTLDASASFDYQTPTAQLQVSWDAAAIWTASFVSTVAPEAAPWTAWTTGKTAVHTYTVPGTYQPRLAVKDTEPGPGGPDVGYATATVIVLPSATSLCTVNTTSDVDDGATSCSGYLGADGKLSLREAVRVINGMAGTPTVAFSGPMTISGSRTNPLMVGHAVNIVAQAGVILDTVSLVITAPGVLVSGLELARLAAPVMVTAGGEAMFEDVHVHDGYGMGVLGKAYLLRVRMSACTASCVKIDDRNYARLAVSHSEFRSPGGNVGIDLATCGPPETSGVYQFSPSIGASVFSGFNVAVRSSCGDAAVYSSTFVANGTAVAGNGRYLLSNVFSGQTVAALDSNNCGNAFSGWSPRQQIVWQNASDGCLAGEISNPPSSPTDTFSADPLYVFPAARDYRIQFGSPAKDSGFDYTSVGYPQDLNDAGPGVFFGAAADRGGRETY